MSYQNQLLPKPFTEKKTSKCATTLQGRYVEIMHLGLDNIIKLNYTTNFDRRAMLNVLKCLTKNFEPI